MKCMLVLALVAVAAAKPTELLKPAVVEVKQPIVHAALPYTYPVAHSLPLTYATAPVSTVYSSPIATPFLAMGGVQKKPELKIKPVEVKAYEKPMEIKAYEKPMEIKAYEKPMEIKAYAQPMELKTFVKPMEIKTYAKPAEVKIAEPVMAYAKPAEVKIAEPMMAYAQPAVVASAPLATPVVTKKLTYAYQPVKTEYVAKPYEIPVKKVEYVNEKTGCKNNFGVDVPCKKFHKREAQHLITAPVTTYTSSLPVHTAIPSMYYNAVPAVVPTATAVEYKALPTKVQKVEVPQPYVKEYVEKVALKPNCMNDYGMAVPCIHYE